MLRLSIENMRITREKNNSFFELFVPSFHVPAGSIVAVLGESGCGKSTLLDTLALILSPRRAATFNFYDKDNNPRSLLQEDKNTLAQMRGKDIGYVLQTGGLLSFLSVEENIMLPGKLLHENEMLLRARCYELAERLNIQHQLKKKPQHLSGGQRQRAAIARSLIHRPSLILADEPTAAVDGKTAQEICKEFKFIAKEHNTTLIIVSHDPELMNTIADYAVFFSLEKRENKEKILVFSTLSPMEKLHG